MYGRLKARGTPVYTHGVAMSMRPRKKEVAPSQPIGSIYSSAITVRPGVLLQSPQVHKPADTGVLISDVGYFTVEIMKKKISEDPDSHIKPTFPDQMSVRITVRLVTGKGDRIQLARLFGTRLGTELPEDMVEAGVPYNGYYCASPELSLYSVTYPATAAFNDAEIPALGDIMKKMFRKDEDGAGIDPGTEFVLPVASAGTSEVFTYENDPMTVNDDTFFKVQVKRKS